MTKIVFINPKKEPNKYDIFTQLKTNGKAIIEKTDSENKWWRDVSKQIGRDTKDMVSGEKKFVITSSNYDHKVGVVTINDGVIVREEKQGNRSKFSIDLLK